MGVNIHAVEFLLEAKTRGLQFGNSITLGRHNLIPKKKGKWPWSTFYNLNPVATELMSRSKQSDGYCETLLKNLGATRVTSIDTSDYEGANLVHDFNLPLPKNLAETFDTVFDFGSIEHVFNLPQAMANLMQLTKLNGHVVLLTTADSYCGHGFYQLSPEFFFRSLSKENGYETLFVGLIDLKKLPRISFLSDPLVSKERLEFALPNPTYIVTVAKRIEIKIPFSSWPQQSLYMQSWQSQSAPPKPTIVRNI